MEQNDIYEWLKSRAKSAIERYTHNKKILFDILEKNKIKSVAICFDGSGDSGGVNSCDFDPEDKSHILVEDVFGCKILESTGFSADGLTYNYQKDSTIEDLINSILYDILESTHAGWETNEGSYGEVHFDVKSKKITFSFSERSVTEYDDVII